MPSAAGWMIHQTLPRVLEPTDTQEVGRVERVAVSPVLELATRGELP
jgi:hypothetical protein